MLQIIQRINPRYHTLYINMNTFLTAPPVIYGVDYWPLISKSTARRPIYGPGRDLGRSRNRDRAKGMVSKAQFSSLYHPWEALKSCVVLEISQAVGESSQKLAHFFLRPGCLQSQLPYLAVKRLGHPRFDQLEPLGADSSHDDVSTTTTGQCLFPRIYQHVEIYIAYIS